MITWPRWMRRRKKVPPPVLPDVIIVRGPSTDEGTFGVLRAGSFTCKTAELPDRGNAPNFSRIPAGRYTCRPYTSARYKDVYILEGVDGRSYILSHSGNVAGDKKKGHKTHSAGCILLGKYFGYLGGQRAVMCSRPVVRAYWQHMGQRTFILDIKEI